MSDNSIILEVTELSKHYTNKRNRYFGQKNMIHAVDRVSFQLEKGRTLGIVGESGCGKTTLSRMLCLIEEPTSGTFKYKNLNFYNLNKKERQNKRKKIQPIFQDPLASLNPRFTVDKTLKEALWLSNQNNSNHEIKEFMSKVGLDMELIDRYPHELSGGQRQRVVIARSLCASPELVIADEAVASLDISIQAQILNLFIKLQRDIGLSIIFISHDLRVISHVSDEVMVMYAGRIMEKAPVQKIFGGSFHPYTRALFDALPKIANDKPIQKNTYSPNEVTIIEHDNPGCKFYQRCKYAKPECQTYDNDLIEADLNHYVACKYWRDI